MKQVAIQWVFIALVIFQCHFAQVVSGDITLPKLFSDHMVLQQKSDCKIWGTADPEQQLVITFGEQTVEAQADNEGNWSAIIQTPAAGGPYQLEIKAKKDQAKVVFNNILVGEVWICGGQENMAMPLANSLNGEKEVEISKDFDQIRFFSVNQKLSPKPLDDFEAANGWSVCSPETSGEFSAAAYYFARALQEKLKVPVGVVCCSWEKSNCEAWISRPALEAEEALQPLLKHWDENDNPTSENRPSNLFNGMISPLKGINFNGFAWYQGEANVGRGAQYHHLLPTLIECWRQELGRPEAPFILVQLSPFRYETQANLALAEIWDAQLKTFRQTKNCGMVVTTDIGNIKTQIPENKREVGRRLALWAFQLSYFDQLTDQEKKRPASGPIFSEIKAIEGTNQLRVTFDCADGGLERRGEGDLNNFFICGDDNQFVPAVAEIDGAAVIVSSPEVENPKAVRFAWDDTAEPNLFNAAGLPASPFRTDDLPLLSEGTDY